MIRINDEKIWVTTIYDIIFTVYFPEKDVDSLDFHAKDKIRDMRIGLFPIHLLLLNKERE